MLYRTTYPLVLAYALRRTPSAADAQDAAAETFAIAWRRIDDIPEGDRGLLWLYGTCRRVTANSRRGRARRLGLVAKLEAQPPPTTDEPQNSVVDRQEILAALRRLSDDDQEILRLVAWEGLTNRQLGDFFGCGEQAAAARVSRARKRLDQALPQQEQSDVDHHSRGPVP